LPGARQTTIRYVWDRTLDHETAWATHFRQKGWFDRTYDKVCDEPPNGCAWADIAARAGVTHAADPQFKTLVTTSIDDANANGVTNSVNILTPPVNEMDNKPGSSKYVGDQRPKYDQFLTNPNNRLFWYQACESHGCNTVGGSYFSGWPSFMIDNTSSQNRSQGMLSWLYKVNGVLYCDITYALANAWNNPYAFGGWGDGTLLYPGKPSIIGGTSDIPVGSIRLQMIREGFQDYEYMKRVADLGDAGFAQSIGQSLFPEVYASNQKPDLVNNARLQLASRILDLTKQGPAWNRLEQTDHAVTLAGNWYTDSNPTFSGGTAALSNQTGARATFNFVGTDAKWIGYRDQYTGIANVYVDGVLLQQLDGYAPGGQPQAVMYYVTGLSAGPHTLSIEVTGQKNSAATQAWVWVDAFEYVAPPSWTRVEQTDTRVAQTGNWYTDSNSIFSGGTAALANQTGARATFNFQGTGARWIAYRDPYAGIANVYVDRTLVQHVDLFAVSSQSQPIAYAVTGLQAGPHTLTVEVSGQKNPAATQAWVWVDAFEYTPPTR
jgi:hypothetical protein